MYGLVFITYVSMASWKLPMRAYTLPILSRALEMASVRLLQWGKARNQKAASKGPGRIHTHPPSQPLHNASIFKS